MRTAPYDYQSVQSQENWRDELIWPVPHRQSFDYAHLSLKAALGLLSKIDDPDLRDVALLSIGMAFASVLPHAEAALTVSKERDAGVRMTGTIPELAYLRGETETLPPARGGDLSQPKPKPPLAPARRLLRALSWTPWPKFPKTLFSPDAIAISHNAMLRESASRACIGFHHADTMFQDARNNHGRKPGITGWQDLVEPFTTALTEPYPISPETQERLQRLVAGQIAKILEVAARDIASMRAAGQLPSAIWAGTGGYWPSRALSIEIIKRGGEVRRFDHGGGNGLNALPELWAVVELTVSNNYVSPTALLSEKLRTSNALDLFEADSSFKFTAGHGDPANRAAAQIARTTSSGPLRVTYTPVSLLGFDQRFPPRLPDLVSLDWQVRFTEMLKTLPIDLTCRPHPEGLFSNGTNPLSATIPLSPRIFEELIADTDVFVFDYIQSTTFYEALCTDRPIVLIDLGLPVYEGENLKLLKDRCRIVPVQYDDRNRPHVDPAALEAAIIEGGCSGDPTAFRELLIGDEA